MQLACCTCGAERTHATCPLLQQHERDLRDDIYLAWLQEIRMECLSPVLNQLTDAFGQIDCRDVDVPDGMRRVLVVGREHGPWDTPQAANVSVYLRGRAGQVYIHMDYFTPRICSSSLSPHQDQHRHCQQQRFKLDDSVQNYFFSLMSSHERQVDLMKNAIVSMKEWRELEAQRFGAAALDLDELAQRVIDAFPSLRNPLAARSNPTKGNFVVKKPVAEFICAQLETVGVRPRPNIPRNVNRVALVRLKRDCSRDALFKSTFGRECQDKGIRMEPRWAKGALAFVQISNPWAMPAEVNIERYHALVAQLDVERFGEMLREAFTYKTRPRFEVVRIIEIEDEALSETMQGYSDMLQAGDELDTKTFTTLIHMCCKRNAYKDAYTLLHEMDVKNICPNEVTLNCMLNTFHRRCGKKAEKLILRMTDKYGVTPTKLAYDVVIKAYKFQRNFTKAGEWQKRLELQYP